MFDMKKRVILCMLILFLYTGTGGVFSNPEDILVDDGNQTGFLHFRWAVVKGYSDGNMEIADTSEHIEIRRGNSFKFYFRPMADVSFYLLCYSTGKELRLDLLYPETQEMGKQRGGFFIPNGKSWYGPDGNPGEEKFFFLASEKPLEKLEMLIEQWRSAQFGGKSSSVVEKAGADVLVEIKRLFTQNSNVQEEPNIPLSYSGTIRGGLDSIDDLGLEVQKKGFYGKTIRFIY